MVNFCILICTAHLYTFFFFSSDSIPAARLPEFRHSSCKYAMHGRLQTLSTREVANLISSNNLWREWSATSDEVLFQSYQSLRGLELPSGVTSHRFAIWRYVSHEYLNSILILSIRYTVSNQGKCQCMLLISYISFIIFRVTIDADTVISDTYLFILCWSMSLLTSINGLFVISRCQGPCIRGHESG